MPHPRISIDPAIMMGKPCIKGTRITVELILCWLAEGRSFAELLEAYPHIAEEDIKAALANTGPHRRPRDNARNECIEVLDPLVD